MIKTVRKIVTVLTISLLLFSQTISVSAFEAPSPPPAPTAPTAETEIAPPPSPPEAPAAPTVEEVTAETTEEISNNNPVDTENIQDPQEENPPQPSQLEQSESNQLAGPSADGNVGDTTIQTGDGLTAGTVTTDANNNLALQQPSEPTGNETIAENTGNGAGSNNSASPENTSDSITIANNNATISNNLDFSTNTGESSASQNVGNSTIITGDANTSGTVITSANTNLSGVAVSEFNIVDDTQQDLVLDFASGCISGCGIYDSVSAANIGNGADSTNEAAVNQTIDIETFQNNEAILENNFTFVANSGENQADKNTGGDSTISTGDANVSANVLNFLNNNLAGNIILGVVNIFGDLIGDIILPEDQLNTLSASASNSGNGADSTNLALIDNNFDNTTLQTNDALIQNNLEFTANTGGNQTSKNTGGNSSIETGEADIESQTLNIANSNIDGGNWWLVLVNEAGQWIGKILGSEDESNIAGSQGTQFSVNPDGDITVTNQENGAGSTNNATATQTNTTSTIQNNVAQIINNLNLFANTGENSASQNTGGDSTIKTGDANIVANLVNFVNNNIVGNGRLTITIVNVFGSWLGDFVTPGSKQTNSTAEDPQDTIEAPANLTNNSENQENPSTTPNTNSVGGEHSSSPAANRQNSSGETSSSLSASPTSVPQFQNSSQAAAQVAGVKITADPDSIGAGNPVSSSNSTQDNLLEDTKKKININLAWLLTLAPFAGISFLIKKRLK